MPAVNLPEMTPEALERQRREDALTSNERLLLREDGKPYSPDMELSWQAFLGNRGAMSHDFFEVARIAYIAAWHASLTYAKRRADETPQSLPCGHFPGPLTAKMVCPYCELDKRPVETTAPPSFREVAVRQVLAAIDAWNKQDGRMCDHDYDLMNDARQELQWILDDHMRVVRPVEPSPVITTTVALNKFDGYPQPTCQANTPICPKCGQIDVRIPRMGIYHVCPTPENGGDEHG